MFTTAYDYDAKSSVDKVADFFLNPCRYFFGGRRVVIIRDFPACEKHYTEQRGIDITIAKLAILIPSTIIGIGLKYVAYWTSPLLRDIHTHVTELEKHPGFLPESFKEPKWNYDFPRKTWDELQKNISLENTECTSKEEWKKTSVISEHSKRMERAYQVAHVIFCDLRSLDDETEGKSITEKYLTSKNRRSWAIALATISEIYNHARGHYLNYIHDYPGLSRNDQLPFYDPSKPQYQWRMLYNSICEDFYKLGIKNTELQSFFKIDRLSHKSIVICMNPESI